MDLAALLVQLLNGLAGASSLFLVAVGLSLIFGVTRIVNFAHGSLFMVGAYAAWSLAEALGAGRGFWPALPLAALACGALGAAVEIVLLRRIYRAPELLQLLATFALVLVIRDAVLWHWGPGELLGPRAPGLEGAVRILERRFPVYDLFLIAVGPLVWLGLHLLLVRTRWGLLVRAATEDRGMAGALGINEAWLFTGVFALGAALAGLASALQLPREPASLEMNLATIGSAFVVVVVGGMGSIGGAFAAALLVAELKALCIWLGVVDVFGVAVAFPKLTLAAAFLVMAVVLVLRPWGLRGKPQPAPRAPGGSEPPLRRAGPRARIAWAAGLVALALLPLAAAQSPYLLVLGAEMLVAALFAASLHFLIGPAGMHSFGHAAYFGIGAYAAALLVRAAGWPMEAALLCGWFCVRLAGVYLAMLTLAFAQITWAVCFQWDAFTGGSNGLTGVWPAAWLQSPGAFYLLALACTAAGVLALRRLLFAPFGHALRAVRDAPLRAEAIGIDARRTQWMGFAVAGLFAGVAGALFAFSKGGVSPEALSVGRSVDALAMVLLGGVQTLAGPLAGAAVFTWLHDSIARSTDYRRAVLGGTLLLLVLLFPQGIAGGFKQLAARRRG
ncbi:ABC transporter permease [Xylophilus sp.]|uniref:ABC transporter permease n=1 Tax=Xylophilus sp. TaxID=2653893 RepID=UPI0013B5EFB9|nr:ABC transporter permease [Xylophilus sp.]KAF1050263.1 MAG: High-affinity branched-chain amino acid transport system permease protein LivH [Xylophilus sp.]